VGIALAPLWFGWANFVLDTVVGGQLVTAYGCGWSIRR
jgi:hypothetical protein